MKLEEVLDVSILVGYHLLCNGADIYRVEQSIQYICNAYAVKEVDAFAIPSSIVVTVSDGRSTLTRTKRVMKHLTNLDRVEKLSGLSRQICASKPAYSVILSQLDHILSMPVRGVRWQYAAQMLAGGSFCIFFGGRLLDAVCSAAIGALILFLTRFLGSLNANSFFITVLCSFSTAMAGGLASHLPGQYLNSDSISIGGIMLLVPGLALANSMRDFISSDTMTGLSRMAEALFIAVAVALGVASAMFFLGLSR